MNVRELMEELSNHDPETIVILASDEEGNSFHQIGSFAKEDFLYIYPAHEPRRFVKTDERGLAMPPDDDEEVM